jgi:hypothetical protein
VPIVVKSGSLNLLEPSGPVKACNGIAGPLPLHLINAANMEHIKPGTVFYIKIYTLFSMFVIFHGQQQILFNKSDILVAP